MVGKYGELWRTGACKIIQDYVIFHVKFEQGHTRLCYFIQLWLGCEHTFEIFAGTYITKQNKITRSHHSLNNRHNPSKNHANRARSCYFLSEM